MAARLRRAGATDVAIIEPSDQHYSHVTHNRSSRIAKRLYGLVTTVRRQGLQPRTRGLRVGEHLCLVMMAELTA